jgi:aminoglycoside phosphotransferase (APT) family kinase protein
VLEVAHVAPYLTRKGLLGARAVVDGRLRVIDVSRRNRVFMVTADDEPSYIVKLPDDANDRGVAHEAAVLQRLQAEGGDGRAASFLPTVVVYDAGEGVLILEAPPGAHNLAQQHARGRFSRALAREAGRALAVLHSVEPGTLDDLRAPDPTWALAIHRPSLHALRTLSAASVELVRTIQGSPALCAALDELIASSQRVSVIHGDIRWENCLVLSHRGTTRRTRLLLIDWELAAAGDPALDIGAFFSEYLRVWLRPGNALPAIRPAVGAFWEAYERHRGHSTIELSRTLRRALRFAGASLVLTALEDAQELAELRETERSTLKLGTEVLRRPDEAAAHLLGFRTTWDRG